MCQCLLCDCCWCNFCGVFFAGVAYNLLCCRCWVCKEDNMAKMDPECCHCGWSGYGGNCCCYGMILCAPPVLRQWSSTKKKE